MKPMYFFGDFSPAEKVAYGIVKTPYQLNNEKLQLESSDTCIKLKSSDGQPLVRLDYKQHGSNPPMHLQYGGEENGFNPYRSGNEAAEIVVKILQLSKLVPVMFEKTK
ncbi:hypothetical protein KAJ87_00225 [Candidatus Pacearchaeota archaeon]|nr:hypothetical protein [Candidatus Pacearchaeota archaeon]